MIRTATDNVIDPGELLRHAAWARRLARTLVRDEADADDLVQDGLLSVWRRPPPDPAAPIRPWLRVLMRNRSINRAREDRRRETREAGAPQSPEAASPEELVGRLEIHKVLADAVLALQEPYRRTVLLRYFEELSSSEIAARTNVPA
ncbi:MAG TPA: sigma-70 family RNA polymerase sigma factor, partial [Polyangia bacterium]